MSNEPNFDHSDQSQPNNHDNQFPYPEHMRLRALLSLDTLVEMFKQDETLMDPAVEIDDPDYPEWIKDIARKYVRGEIRSWDEVRTAVNEHYPLPPGQKEKKSKSWPE